ncbi:MAG: hypothetical protein ACFFCS_01350 [Candidatus Hodarchaeota archaeon]
MAPVFGFGKKEDGQQCDQCGYVIYPPVPQKCPKCNNVLDKTGYQQVLVEKEAVARDSLLLDLGEESKPALEKPKEEKVEEKVTVLSEDGDYLKMMGVTNFNTREILFCSNPRYEYLMELGANALEISRSILGGTLEKILFEPSTKHVSSRTGEKEVLPFEFEDAAFLTTGPLLFCIYGVFFKRPEILLKGLKNIIIDIFKGEVKESLSKMEKHELNRRKDSITAYILKEYKKLRESVLQKSLIPTLEDIVKVHYVGMSYESIGTMSLLVTRSGDDALPINDATIGAVDEASKNELVESLISAQIEAIAANTLANTGAFPRYIITNIGYDKHRIIEFVQLPNGYCLQVLASGNAEIMESAVQNIIFPRVIPVTDQPFRGMLTRFNEVKEELRSTLENAYIFKIQQE